MKTAFKKTTSLVLAVAILIGAIGIFGLVSGAIVAWADELMGAKPDIAYKDVANNNISTVVTVDGVTTYTVTKGNTEMWFKSIMDANEAQDKEEVSTDLSGYDAYSFYLDTASYGAGEIKPNQFTLKMLFYYVGSDGKRKECLASKFWYISDSGDVFYSNVPADGKSILPDNFKGTVYVLFENVPGFDASKANYYVTRFMKVDVDNAVVRMGKTKMVSNGQTTIDTALEAKNDVHINTHANPANGTYTNGTVSITGTTGESNWWKNWVYAPYVDDVNDKKSDHEGKFTIDLTGYDAYAFDIDLSGTILGNDSNGNTAGTLGLDTLFYITEGNARVLAGKPTKLHLIDKDTGKSVTPSGSTLIPGGFKGTVYILLDEVTRETTKPLTANLANASVVVGHYITTGASENPVTFGMDNMRFIANGALTVKKAEAIAELENMLATNETSLKPAGAYEAAQNVVNSATDNINNATTVDDVTNLLAAAKTELAKPVNAGAIQAFQNSFNMTKGAQIRMVPVEGKYAITYQVTYSKTAYDTMVTNLSTQATVKANTDSFEVGMVVNNQEIKLAKTINGDTVTLTYTENVDANQTGVNKAVKCQGYVKYQLATGGETRYIYANQYCNEYSVADVARIAVKKTTRYNADQIAELQKIIDLADGKSVG